MKTLLFCVGIAMLLPGGSAAGADERAVIGEGNANVEVRSDFGNLRAAGEKRKKVHVAFLGGSITQNTGGHTAMVPAWLRERFPEAKIVETNAGLGSTCSTSGAFRVGAHILSKGKIDLFVVEFAVNDDQDAAHARQECIRGMEGVVRQVRREQPNCEIVMIHYVNPEMLATVQEGKTPISIGAHEAVAKHYGVTSVNVAAEVADAIAAETYDWKDYGGTHPKKFGYEVASNMVIAAIEAGLAKNVGKQVKKELPAMMDAFSYAGGGFVPHDEMVVSKGWKRGKVSRELIPKGGIREQYEPYDLLRGEKVGETAALEFEGSAVGAFLLAGPDAGIVETRVDGGEWVERDLFHRFSKKLNYPRSVVFHDGLEPGKHEFELRISEKKNAESAGNVVNVLFFEVNAPVEAGGEGDSGWTELFDGKTTKGWTPREEIERFEAVDGELHLISKKNVWVTSDLKLKDFIFEGEVKNPEDAAEAGFNGGLAFRCTGETGKPKGYQCEIEGKMPGETGGVYGIGLGGWLYPKKEEAAEHRERIEKANLKPKGWNAYRVRCEGKRIQTWVNGVMISDIEDEQSLGGYFGIQHHGKGGVVKFRNLRVKEL